MLLGIKVEDDVVPLTLRPEVEYDASPVLAFLHEHPAHFGTVQLKAEFKF